MLPRPTDREIFEGELATYWLRDDCILVSVSKSPVRTVEKIKENHELVKRITNGKKVPLLIYLTNSPVPDKETRKFSAEQLPNVYTATAMISKPGLARLIMGLVFKLNPPTIPMKSFTDDHKALEWLREYL